MQQIEKEKLTRQRIRNRLFLLALVLSVLFWFIESAANTFLFHERSYQSQLLAPSLHDLWHRVVVLTFIGGFAIHADTLINRRRLMERALRASEEKYRRLVELSPEAIGIVADERLVLLNEAGTKMLGATNLESIVGRLAWDFVQPQYREQIARQYQLISANKQDAFHIEMKIVRLDGTPLDVEVTAIPFIYEGKPAAQVIFRNISERKRAEEEIRQRNEELAALNAIATTVSQSLNLEKILNGALDEVLKLGMFGEQADGLIHLWEEGDSHLKLIAKRGVPPNHACLLSSPEVGECLCGRVIETGQRILVKSALHDKRHDRRWSEMCEHQDICLPLSVRGKVLGVMNLKLPQEQQVTERNLQMLSAVADQIGVAIENARLFDEVSLQRQQLLALGARIAEVEASERKHLARELHDQVGQNLTALGINLNIIRSQLSADSAAIARQRAEESLALLEETTERIRDIMSELRPPMLDDYGLVASLRWYATKISQRSGFIVTVKGTESAKPLPARVENALFRIAQEALTNVAKHAQAQNVTVTMTVDEGVARMIVADDGLGFDPRAFLRSENERGWGLLIMAERAEALGGHCWIESDPVGGGTQVTAEIAL